MYMVDSFRRELIVGGEYMERTCSVANESVILAYLDNSRAHSISSSCLLLSLSEILGDKPCVIIGGMYSSSSENLALTSLKSCSSFAISGL